MNLFSNKSEPTIVSGIKADATILNLQKKMMLASLKNRFKTEVDEEMEHELDANRKKKKEKYKMKR